MRTIRGRVFLSLVLVMIFSLAVTITLFSNYTISLLRDQARIQLENQLETALEVLNGGQISDLDAYVFQLKIKDHLFGADYAVLDATNRVLASSDPSWVGTRPPAGPNGTTGRLTQNGEYWLYTVDMIDNGPQRLMLVTPVGDLQGFNRQWITLSAVAVSASTVFIFMVGVIFIWNTTRPLKKLKQAVSEFQPYQKSTGIPDVDSRSEIGQLMHTFHSMADRIRSHHEHQADFLHRVSHELRTPLMSIQGYAMAIKDKVLPAEQALEVIHNESRRLIQMVERLLEFSRLEGANEEWPVFTVDLREMAEQAVEIVAPLAADKNIEATVEGLETLECQVPGEQFFQVILNLAQNAIRHARSRVRLSVTGTPASWVIQVDDDGPGVPDSLKETVFSRYYTGAGGGTGLGLAICRQIADRIGAAVVCGDSEWGGASFRFYKEKPK